MLRGFALFVALVVPTSSFAQSPPSSIEIDEVRRDARFRTGPLYTTPTLLLKELGIDSNVFNETGDQKSDFTFTLSPKADLWLPVARRALLQGTVGTDLVWYREYAAERSVAPQLSLRGELYLRRVTLFGERGYLKTRERPNYEIDSRSRRVEDTVSAGAEIGLTPSLSLEAAAHRRETRYDSDAQFDGTNLQRALNRKRSGLQVTARQRLTSLTSVSVKYETFRDEFEYSSMRDSRSYGVLSGVELKPRALISGSAYAGYRKFTPEVPSALPEFGGLLAQLGLSYTLLGSTTFGVNYSRDLAYSYNELQPFFVDDSVGVSVRRALGSRFDALVSADRHEYDYQDAIAAGRPGGAVPRVDITWNYAGSIGYRLGRDGRIAFGVSYWRRESTTEQFRNFDNLRFGSTISYGF